MLGVSWAALGVFVALGVPATSAAISTWLRSRRNARKLDALLLALGVDPENPPEYDLSDTLNDGMRADGGNEDA